MPYDYDRTASLRRAADEDEGGLGIPIRRGRWHLIIFKGRPSRWDFSLRNPHGGSSGSTSYTSIAGAYGAAVGRGVLWGGAKDFDLTIAKWDAAKEKYVVTKDKKVEIPEDGKPPMPKLATELA